MPLSLVTRAGNGAALSATQNDTNLTDIETAVNNLETTSTTLGSDKLSITAFDAFFEGTDSGKKQVDWARITNKPSGFTNPAAFRGTKTDADQTLGAPGTIVVNFPTQNYDYGSVYNPSLGQFTAPANGVYNIGANVQVSLTSGSPTGVSIISSVIVNAAAQDQTTYDNTGTGIRIYKHSTQLYLSAGDIVFVQVDFDWTGSAVWQVDASNTAMWGSLAYAT